MPLPKIVLKPHTSKKMKKMKMMAAVVSRPSYIVPDYSTVVPPWTVGGLWDYWSERGLVLMVSTSDSGRLNAPTSLEMPKPVRKNHTVSPANSTVYVGGLIGVVI